MFPLIQQLGCCLLSATMDVEWWHPHTNYFILVSQPWGMITSCNLLHTYIKATFVFVINKCIKTTSRKSETSGFEIILNLRTAHSIPKKALKLTLNVFKKKEFHCATWAPGHPQWFWFSNPREHSSPLASPSRDGQQPNPCLLRQSPKGQERHRLEGWYLFINASVFSFVSWKSWEPFSGALWLSCLLRLMLNGIP